MKNVIIINSPIYWNKTEEQEEYLPPLGLGYIATYLEIRGFGVEIIDCVKQRLGVEDVIKVISDKKPDYVGINIFTQNYQLVKTIIEGISNFCICFIGGPVVKSIFEDILLWDMKNDLDIIIGEGEFIIPDILNDICKEQPLKVVGNKKIYKVDILSTYFPKDISSIHVNRKYLQNEIVTNHYGEREAAIITSRGCVFDCAFCGGAKSLNQDVSVRSRTENSVVIEINELITLYPEIRSIRILDDLFLKNEKSIDMANRIFRGFEQLSWRGMVHTISLIKSLNKIELLKDSKCKELFMGIETGAPELRKKINKLGSVEDIVNVATKILENGIDLKGYFIYGFPGETIDDCEKTYKLACDLMDISRIQPGVFRTSVFKYRPYHGTLLYKEIADKIGDIPECRHDEATGTAMGRSQFSFSSGNYSEVSDKLLNEFIEKTQNLMEYNNDRTDKKV